LGFSFFLQLQQLIELKNLGPQTYFEENDRNKPLVIVSFSPLSSSFRQGHNWRIEPVTVECRAYAREERERVGAGHAVEDGGCPVGSTRLVSGREI